MNELMERSLVRLDNRHPNHPDMCGGTPHSCLGIIVHVEVERIETFSPTDAVTGVPHYLVKWLMECELHQLQSIALGDLTLVEAATVAQLATRIVEGENSLDRELIRAAQQNRADRATRDREAPDYDTRHLEGMQPPPGHSWHDEDDLVWVGYLS